MRKPVWPRLAVVWLGCLALWLAACSARVTPPDEWARLAQDDVDQLLQGYDLPHLLQHIRRLSAPELQGRAAGTAGENLAGDYLIGELQAIGLQPWRDGGFSDFRQSLRVKNGMAENILAVLPGKSQRSLLVLAAHYDHLGIQNGCFCPGADDNAAGVATALETARCLAQSGVQPARTVLIALLTGEEAGLKGSAALAGRLQRNGFSRGAIVLNLDMLGGVGGNSLDVWLEKSRPSGQGVATLAEQEIRASGIGAKRLQRRFGPVDSASFARKGMPSITLSWDLTRENHPYRHTPNDTYENLRGDLIEQGSRAAMRVALALANYLK